MDFQQGQWRSIGEGGDQGGDEWDKENSEECGKLGIPMIQKQWQQRKKLLKAVLATSQVSVMPNKLKRLIAMSRKFVTAKHLDG